MLRIKIGGSWEPKDFIEVLQAVEGIYYKLWLARNPTWFERYFGRGDFMPDFFDTTIFERSSRGPISYADRLDLANQRLTERARYSVQSRERLKVRRITYASPGGIDLLGIGKVCEVVAGSIGSMKRYWDEAHLRRERDAQATIDTEKKRTEAEIAKETLRDLQIKNARAALELEEKYPDRQDVLIPLLVRDQEMLSPHIAEGKLIGATNRDAVGPSSG